jgi:hypothetical protein
MDEEFYLYSLFNTQTRQFVCFTFDIDSFPLAIRNNMLIKKHSFKELGINDEEINIQRFRWIGDYDTGRLADIVLEKKAVVTEQEIDEKYDALFFDKYDLKTVLYELVLNADMKTENGKKMQTHLEKILKKKKDDIEFFKNSDLHIWETREDIKKRKKDAFKT